MGSRRNPDTAVACVVDLGERKRAEEALQRAHAELATRDVGASIIRDARRAAEVVAR